ncbi:MAG: DUF2975 domain-containing protein [Turicibacter sp.]
MFNDVDKWMRILINCVLGLMIVAICLGVIAVGSILVMPKTTDMTPLFMKGVYMLVNYLLVFYPLYQLRKIIRDISEQKIFTEWNITRFKKISHALFLLVLLSYGGRESSYGIEILAFGNYSFKMETLFLLILALLAVLMSYIFRQAKDYKQEAKYLKEENELTI